MPRCRIDPEESLPEREARFRSIFEQVAVGICYFSRDGRRLHANRRFQEILGYDEAELRTLRPRHLTFAEDRAAATERRRRLSTGELDGYTVERRCVRKDGSTVWVNMTVSLVHDPPAGEYFLGTLEDITARKQAELALAESEARFRALTENSFDVMSICRADGTLVYVTPAVERLQGYRVEEVLGTVTSSHTHPDDLPIIAAGFAEMVAHPGRTVHSEVRIRHADGSWRWVEIAAKSLLHDPAVQGIIANVHDITDRKAAQEALQHLALHDALTGLPNRSLLQDRVAQALREARRHRTPLALLILDLDRFKDINDSLGHHAGDRLLLQVGPRLQGVLRDSDTVARLGGDEFAVVLPGADREGALLTARKLRQALAPPFVIDRYQIAVGASAGIALYPDQGRSVDTLMQRADAAMYAAKRSGAGQAVYAPAPDVRGAVSNNRAARVSRV